MNFSRKPTVPVPEEMTEVWTCSQDGCNGWMRDKFSFENTPACPLCHAEMKKDNKMLPVV